MHDLSENSKGRDTVLTFTVVINMSSPIKKKEKRSYDAINDKLYVNLTVADAMTLEKC